MTLHNKNVEFEYLTANSDRFTNDFMNFVLTDVPFFALQDQLLYLMEKRSHTKFRIPGYLTVDSKDHIFYFERIEDQTILISCVIDTWEWISLKSQVTYGGTLNGY
ncbi:DUF5960 family protein [Enterococcus avium]|nr:DUF5960 family protein [Enterococcus avium]